MIATSVLERLQNTGRHAIELANISCKFGALVALEDINLAVPAGERRAILGSNGAGKTTLFNLITGDIPATEGLIHFFGENITEIPTHQRIRRGLRRTYQISLLFNDLTVRDNLLIACNGTGQAGMSLRRDSHSSAANTMTQSLLAAIRLEQEADQLVNEMSHGQQRQLEIGMALAGAPRFILFDEPAAGLSQNERVILIEILNALPVHIGYIIIEHDMDVALRVSSQVSLLHNGKVFREGTPEEIENDEQVQALYLGNAVN